MDVTSLSCYKYCVASILSKQIASRKFKVHHGQYIKNNEKPSVLVNCGSFYHIQNLYTQQTACSDLYTHICNVTHTHVYWNNTNITHHSTLQGIITNLNNTWRYISSDNTLQTSLSWGKIVQGSLKKCFFFTWEYLKKTLNCISIFLLFSFFL